jgi:hypothetical protein
MRSLHALRNDDKDQAVIARSRDSSLVDARCGLPVIESSVSNEAISENARNRRGDLLTCLLGFVTSSVYHRNEDASLCPTLC